MKLEDQVISLPLAKRLKELGVKQKSHFIWANGGHKWFVSPDHEIIRINDPGYAQPGPAAYTVAELGALLPPTIDPEPPGTCYWFSSGKMAGESEGEWLVSYSEDGNFFPGYGIQGDTEADARAKMLIYLIEKGLVKP